MLINLDNRLSSSKFPTESSYLGILTTSKNDDETDQVNFILNQHHSKLMRYRLNCSQMYSYFKWNYSGYNRFL